MRTTTKIWPEFPLPEGVRVSSLYTVFEETYDEDYFYVGEAHDFWEAVYAPDGPVGVTAGESVFVLEPGQILLHPPMEFHRIWAVGKVPPHIMIISFRAEHLYFERPRVFSLSEGQKEAFFEVFSIFRKNMRFHTESVYGIRPGRVGEVRKGVKKWEHFLLSLDGRQTGLKSVTYSSETDKYREIVMFLEANLSRSLTLPEIAAACGVSVSGLKKVFSKYTGMGLKKYFNERKMRTAVSLLRTGHSVKETAYALGFEDPNYFSTVFKRITGSSPLHYRTPEGRDL